MAKIKVNELTQQTPQLNDTLLASGENNEYACKIDDLKNLIAPSGEALKNIKDAENGGVIEGLVNGEAGQVNVASGKNAHVEGGSKTELPNGVIIYSINTASGDSSHAEGERTTASGALSHAEGRGTEASGDNSHAEGGSTTASGQYSHAEGDSTTASGQSSHAEGISTTASGAISHAEGWYTTASGDYSHAEGTRTIANHRSQHIFGEYNIEDPSQLDAKNLGNYVEIVGNGTGDSKRSNARTLDWSGNEWLAGKLTVGTQPTEDNDVATKKYVDENSGGLNNIKDAENGGIIEGLVNGETGQVNVASGKNAHAEGGTTAIHPTTGETMYVINQATGECSHAEGVGTTASGQGSHSEGAVTTASGSYSHAEGYNTTASREGSHSEGEGTTASGVYSHAEGGHSTASGNYSHTEGMITIAKHRSQHVFGEYNIEDPSTVDTNKRGTYVEIVGNGLGGSGSNAHSNARTLDWSGNEWLAGSISPDGGVILKSPNGTAFKLTVSDNGTLSATNVNT